MKKQLFSIVLFLISYSVYSQIPVPEYTYDNVGNRVQRKIVLVIPDDPRLFGDSIPSNNDNAIKFGTSVFPNPASDGITVSISSLDSISKATIFLFDEQGKELARKQQTNKQETIDIKNYKAGTYYLKIIIDKEYVYYKMLKL